MGFTPLEGTMMAKRSGTADPGTLLWLLREGHLDAAELEDGLYHRSGLLGLSGTSDDTRDLVRDDGARRVLAAMVASFDRVDALVFTGDIGWDQPEVADAIADGLGVLGIHGGQAAGREHDAVISPADAAVPVLAIESREELALAQAAIGAH